jgi:uncharacterized Zn finger protein
MKALYNDGLCSFCQKQERRLKRELKEEKNSFRVRCRKCGRITHRQTLQKYDGMCVTCFLFETGFGSIKQYEYYMKELKRNDKTQNIQ